MQWWEKVLAQLQIFSLLFLVTKFFQIKLTLDLTRINTKSCIYSLWHQMFRSKRGWETIVKPFRTQKTSTASKALQTHDSTLDTDGARLASMGDLHNQNHRWPKRTQRPISYFPNNILRKYSVDWCPFCCIWSHIGIRHSGGPVTIWPAMPHGQLPVNDGTEKQNRSKIVLFFI